MKVKKYYLLNLPEEERAIDAIARILRYGAPDTGSSEESGSESSGGGSEENVDIDIDNEETIDI